MVQASFASTVLKRTMSSTNMKLNDDMNEESPLHQEAAYSDKERSQKKKWFSFKTEKKPWCYMSSLKFSLCGLWAREYISRISATQVFPRYKCFPIPWYIYHRSKFIKADWHMYVRPTSICIDIVTIQSNLLIVHTIVLFYSELFRSRREWKFGDTKKFNCRLAWLDCIGMHEFPIVSLHDWRVINEWRTLPR